VTKAISLAVLLVEDSEIDAQLIVRALKKAGYDVDAERVETVEQMRASLEQRHWDIVISDYNLPQFDGLSALRLLRARGLDLPFILVSGAIGEDIAVSAIKEGADDYLLKDRMARLGPAVTHALQERELREQKRRAEEALRQSENRFRALIENSTDGIVLLDPDGTVLYASQATTRILGGTADEWLGGNVFSRVHPDDLPHLFERFSRLVQTPGEIMAAQCRYRHKDESWRWLEVVGQNLLAEPSVGAIVVNHHDITVRKQAEARLRLQSAALEAAANGIVITDRQGTILWVNPAFTRLTGYTAEEAIGQTPRILQSGQEDRAFYQALWDSILAGQVWRGEIVNRRKDGSLYTEEMIITPVRDTLGEISHFIDIKQDITERKRAEAALRDSEEYFRSLIENVSDIITVLDSAGTILYESPSIERVLGYKPEELLGQNAFEWVHPEELAHTAEAFARGFQSAESTPLVEARFRHKDGSWRVVEMIGKPARDRSGQTIGIVNTRDITQRKRAEEETRLLLALTQAINEAPDFDSALRMALQKVCASADWVMGEAWIPRADGGALELSPIWYGQRPGLGEFITGSRGFAFASGEGLPGRVWASRQAEWLMDVSVDGDIFPRAALATQAGIQAALAVPTVAGDQMLVLVFFMREAREEERRPVEIVSAAVAQLGSLLQRKQAEEALRNSEARYRVLFEQSPNGVLLVDLETGKTIEANETAHKQLGYTREEFAALRISDYEVLEKPEETARHMQKVIREGNDDFETLHRTKSGEIRDVRVLAKTIQLSDRGLFYAIFQDITERKRAEAQIMRQLQRITGLRTIDMAITSSFDLRLTLSVVLDEATVQLRVDAADVLLFNPHLRTLEYAAGRGFRGRAIERSRFRLGEGQAGRAVLERCMIQHPDLAASGAVFAQAEILAAENVAAYFAVPLIAKGEVKGVLEIFHRSPLKPDSEWLNFLETLARQAAIAIDNTQLFDNLQRSNVELSLAYDSTIEGWSRAMDLRDKETEGHTQRVTEITMRLAQAMGIGAAELVHIRRGALLHDIGKMGVPDSILLKPGPLTDEERAVIQMHPQHAFDMLSPIAYLHPALDIPYCHHEKWDGSGYPRGLKGEQIPLAARLFAVVDVWDALRSDRPYRAAWSEEKVIEYIQAGSGAHFDPKAAGAFLKVLGQT
jgi:PAS domain S-box-containing protein